MPSLYSCTPLPPSCPPLLSHTLRLSAVGRLYAPSPSVLTCALFTFQTADGRKASTEDALTSYKAASEIAVTELPPTHPIRLGLALNFSVFYYEILNSPDRACQLAKQARPSLIPALRTHFARAGIEWRR